VSRSTVNKEKRSNSRVSQSSSGTGKRTVETKKQHRSVEAGELRRTGPPTSSKTLGTRPFVGAKNVKVFYHDFDERTANALCAQQYLQVDTETDGLDFRKHKLRIVQIGTSNRSVYIVREPGPVHVSPNLHKVLNHSYPRKIFHHAAFDTRFILAYMNTNVMNVECTKVLMKIMHPHLKSGLFESVENLLHVTIPDVPVDYKAWAVEELDGNQKEYICNDVLYLQELWHLLAQQITPEQFNIYIKALTALEQKIYLDVAGYDDLLDYPQNTYEEALSKRAWHGSKHLVSWQWSNTYSNQN
jgi:ribonuclease D